MSKPFPRIWSPCLALLAAAVATPGCAIDTEPTQQRSSAIRASDPYDPPPPSDDEGLTDFDAGSPPVETDAGSPPMETDAGAAPTTACDVAHPSGGCDDAEVSACVEQLAPNCGYRWEARCAGIAAERCGPRYATGMIACNVYDHGVPTAVPLVGVPVVLGGGRGVTDVGGYFRVRVGELASTAAVRVEYHADFVIGAGTAAERAHPIRIINDVGADRADEVDVRAYSLGRGYSLDTLTLDSLDCELWGAGVRIAQDYHRLRTADAAPEIRFLRRAGSYVGVPYVLYDSISVPTDFRTDSDYLSQRWREETLFHEYGHILRDLADGSETHWHHDNARFVYAQSHAPTEIHNEGYAFHEGWASYWGRRRGAPGRGAFSGINAADTDWSEGGIANRLMELSACVRNTGRDGDRVLLDVLRANPERIHTLREFEARFFDDPANAACPARADWGVCPQTYTNVGVTCTRFATVKPSYGRGVGTVPSACPPGEERSGALCYPACPEGFYGVGPVCWQRCPTGYTDDGLTCRRNARIIGSNNSACPWYDICGLTFARGCSYCPPGYRNDGCTCRRDAHIFGKSARGRGVGHPLNHCGTGREYDAGLCYNTCGTGFHGVGPVCWGECPAGYRDDGGTCWISPDTISRYVW